MAKTELSFSGLGKTGRPKALGSRLTAKGGVKPWAVVAKHPIFQGRKPPAPNGAAGAGAQARKRTKGGAWLVHYFGALWHWEGFNVEGGVDRHGAKKPIYLTYGQPTFPRQKTTLTVAMKREYGNAPKPAAQFQKRGEFTLLAGGDKTSLYRQKGKLKTTSAFSVGNYHHYGGGGPWS